MDVATQSMEASAPTKGFVRLKIEETESYESDDSDNDAMKAPTQSGKDRKFRNQVVSEAGTKLWADMCDEEEREKKNQVAQAARVTRVAKDMEAVNKFVRSQRVIAEAYSPPRMTAEGHKMSLKCCFAFDLTVPDSDGTVWDFNKRSASARLQSEKPYMLL